MKKTFFTAIIFLGGVFIWNSLLGQNWLLKTVNDGYAVKAIDDSGEQYDLMAVQVEGDDCFMDIEVEIDDQMVPVKLIASDSLYIPVEVVMEDGKMMRVYAITQTGTRMPVKGVGRAGNTIRVAAIPKSGEFHDIIAYNTDGATKKVAAVKFQAENVEQEVRDVRIIAHLKAMPSMDVKTTEFTWKVKAVGNDGSELDIVALNKKGKEYAVNAKTPGGNFSILDVKAITPRDEINVKLRKYDSGIKLEAIDYYGRVFPVKIKKADGTYLDIFGGENCGKVIDITATSEDGTDYLLHAISPAGDRYDIKGIKILDEDNEGYIQGLEGLVFYYAHVKAFPPVQ